MEDKELFDFIRDKIKVKTIMECQCDECNFKLDLTFYAVTIQQIININLIKTGWKKSGNKLLCPSCSIEKGLS